ncbi:Sulfite exporter TauE/SafE family protein 3 [Glycine max]|nr:Sulfite exporter TauE/SafE family protein 3 [Glycine max]
MAVHGSKRWAVKWVAEKVLVAFLLLVSVYVASSQQNTDQKTVSSASNETKGIDTNAHHAEGFYKHTWPEMKFGWKIIVGSIIGFLGSAFGTVGGVGGGGIFVPMLTLIIGFDARSATAISKCMITGGAGATIFYNLKQRHPTLDMPVIDYDLALLFQPMLMLGISIGVAFNVIFPDWMLTALLIVVFIGLSFNAFFKGVKTWKKETIVNKEARQNVRLNDTERTGNAAHPQTEETANESHTNTNQSRKKVSVIENIYWKELGILVSVWILILALQIGKVPITVGTTVYEAVLLYKGKRKIASKGDQQTRWRVHQLILYCTCGIIAGIIGGLLGLGGGFILGPLFIGLGIHPQVSSATSTFAMTFSASMSVVEYYLLKRFPIPYALYFVAVATAAALVGQHLVRKVIAILGRTSLIIFILALTVFRPMAVHVPRRWDVKWVVGKALIAFLLLVSVSATSSHQNTDNKTTSPSNGTIGVDHHAKAFYKHHWPSMKFGWRIIVGAVVGFLGSAFGTVGGVGGGGIFVPMLTLIVGFDQKSATAISKCMITGGATATVFYNLRQRHPTLDLPVIDYDLALLFQPMLMLGISIGVAFNVIFPEWMLTVLLIIFFVGISVKSFFKGVDTWKKETIMKKEAKKNSRIDDIGSPEDDAHYIQTGDPTKDDTNQSRKKVSIIENIRWKELGLLFAGWIMILALEIGKVPIAVGMSSYEAVRLYKGKRIIASKGDKQTHWCVLQLVLFCACGTLAGMIAGLLGLGGGFILGPLFLGLGIPPQVASATSTLVMAFSASMAVVEYYLLKRFPVPYALYFVAIATAAALVGQHLVRKAIAILGRASVIIFILTLTLSVSAVLLGGVGIAHMIQKIENKEYMGFGDLCTYRK